MPRAPQDASVFAASLFFCVFLWPGTSIPAAPERASDADAADTAIDQIVVVAHKEERSIRDIAANVTVITRTALDATLVTTIEEVFRYAPGIDYEAAGTRFGAEGINIRGIGGNRVALLVDGVPLSDQFDVGSFSNATRDFIDTGLIERVEVLHGPASALYGSAAIGGVVAVRTPDPTDVTGGAGSGADLLATWRGADDSLNGTGMAALANGRHGLLLGGSLREGQQADSAAASSSIDLRDYRRRAALLKYVFDDVGGRTWRVGLMHQDSGVRSDLNSMLGSGRFASTTALEGDDDYRLDMLNAEFQFGHPGTLVDAGVIRGYWAAASVIQRTLDERGLAARPVAIDRFFRFDQDLAGLELNLHKELDGLAVGHRLGFGVEYRERRTSEYRDGLETGLVDGLQSNVLLGEVFPLRDFPVSDTREWGAYLEDVVSFGDWTLIAALRADRYALEPETDPMYAEDYPFADPVSIDAADLSPKLGAIYHISQATDLYVQYSHGFRAPPYEDANIGLELPLFNYRAVPNPDLRSETSDGFELGFRWQAPNASLRAGVFRTRYDDFIESKVRVGTDPLSGRVLFQSQNLSAAVIEGFEAGGELRFDGALENLTADAALYLARGENRDNGQPLNSVGPAQAVLGANWVAAGDTRGLRLQGTLTAAWSDRDESGGELFQPPGHAVFDLYFTQRFGERMRLHAGLLNVTDRSYWNWSDVRGLAPGDPVLPYLAQPGRSLSVSLDMNW